MNRFLLLALTAGLFSPIAAKAESVWLVLKVDKSNGGMALEKIQMKNMNQCENEIQKLADRWDYASRLDKLRKFACVTGK